MSELRTCEFCARPCSSLTRQEHYGKLVGYACALCSIARSTTKKFLAIPACSGINFNPKTCSECGGLAGQPWDGPCNECTAKFSVVYEREQQERRKELRDEMKADVASLHRTLQVAKKPDSGFYYVMTCVVIAMVAAYSYLIWCLL